MKLEFSRQIQISDLIKIRPVVAEVLHADGRTDGHTDSTKLIVTFRSSLGHAKIRVRSIIIRSLTLVAGRNVRSGSRFRVVWWRSNICGERWLLSMLLGLWHSVVCKRASKELCLNVGLERSADNVRAVFCWYCAADIGVKRTRKS